MTKQSYTEEQIERGLHELALCSGSARHASRRLDEDGVHIPRKTLEDWKKRHAERYARTVKDVLPKVYERVAQRNEALVEDYIKAEHVALDQFHAKASEMRAGEASTAARNFGVAKAVAQDKAALIRGKPTEIREDKNIKALIQALANRFPSALKVDAETEAVEEDVGSTAALPNGDGSQRPHPPS